MLNGIRSLSPTDFSLTPSTPIALELQPITSHGTTLGALVDQNTALLSANLERLEQDSTIPDEIKTPLLACGQSYDASTLENQVQGREGELLMWGRNSGRMGSLFHESTHKEGDPVHKKVAQLDAFSQALGCALKGDLTDTQSEALDTYFRTDQPSWANQAALITGMGCLVLSPIALLSEMVWMNDVDRYESLIVPSAVASASLLFMGLGTVAGAIYQRNQARQVTDEQAHTHIELRSQERQLLDALNVHMRSGFVSV